MSEPSINSPQQKPTRAPLTRRRRVLSVGLYLLYLLALLGLLELSLQVIYVTTVGQWLSTRVAEPMFVPNEYTVYWNKPHLEVPHRTNEFSTMVYTNGQGLRVGQGGADYLRGKQPGVERILLLGPSMAFGWGVDHEQTFATQLQELLNQARDADAPRCEVINAGVPSMDPAMNLQWYRKVGQDFAPDRVIQFVYGSMVVPVKDNWNEDVEVNAEGYLINRNATTRHRIIGYAKRSATVFYTWQALNRLRAWWVKGNGPRKIEGAGRKLELQDTFSPSNPKVVESMQYYNDIRATVEASGTKLTIISFPMSYCVHPEDAGRWQHLDTKDIQEQIQFDAAFCNYLRSEGFDCLNITPELQRAAENGERLYYFVDVHWTPAGNQTAAQAAARHLQGPN